MALPKKKSRRSSQVHQLGLECKLVKFNDDENHITYTIQLKCQANDCLWTINKRYNEFYRLNTELQKDRNFRGIKLPHFPGKAISFTDASKKELAQERMQHLQVYLNGLISRTVFLSSVTVRSFLKMPVSVRDLAVILSKSQNAALKQGYMEKKGEINKKWRKRWFVLQPNYILKYYKEESSQNPQGSIDISTIIKIQMKNNTQNKKKYSFTLVAKQRRWFLACDNEAEKREWTRMFMRLRDTKAPLKNDQNLKSYTSTNESAHNLGPHFKTITQVKWCPTIPGILATGSEDESVKIWQTHLLDHTLIPPQYDNNNDDDDNDEGQSQNKQNTKSTISTYPISAIEFQPIAEYKTSGKVTCLEWSPDGSMLVVSLKKQMITNDANKDKYGYFIQCFDLQPILGLYTTDWDDFGGDGINQKQDDKDTDNDNDKDTNNNDMDEDDDSRTKIFTLQDHPSRLVFSSDGSFIYMSMNIDPNSEENEKRRPAFLVYLDLRQNQLHRCKTVDRIIDHQTEFIVHLAMNNARSIMTVATSTHQNKGRLILWNIEKNETRIIERDGTRISSLLFTHDDMWLIIGRNDGKLEFWYKCGNDHDNDNNDDNSNETDILFEKRYEDNIHSGPVCYLTSSNGILISSATASNLEYESFFVDNVICDIRSLINCGKQGNYRIISRLHNVNDLDQDITRLLDLSPVTARHVREGGGPGTLLAAAGDNAVYCHSLVDVILDSLSQRH